MIFSKRIKTCKFRIYTNKCLYVQIVSMRINQLTNLALNISQINFVTAMALMTSMSLLTLIKNMCHTKNSLSLKNKDKGNNVSQQKSAVFFVRQTLCVCLNQKKLNTLNLLNTKRLNHF